MGDNYKFYNNSVQSKKYNASKGEDYNIYSIDSNFKFQNFSNRKSHSKQLDVLNELRTEHDKLKKMNYIQIKAEHENDPLMHSKRKQQSSSLNKKKIQNKQQSLMIQKKKLQNELTNKMKKIQQLLLKQREFQKIIHNMKIQLDSKHDQKDCAKILRKLKNVENQVINDKYKKDIINHKQQLEKLTTENARLNRQLTNKSVQIKQLIAQRNNSQIVLQSQKREKQERNEYMKELQRKINQKDQEYKKKLQQKDEQNYYRETDLKKKIKNLEQDLLSKDYQIRRITYDKNIQFKQIQRKMYEQFYRKKSQEIRQIQQNHNLQKEKQINQIIKQFQQKNYHNQNITQNYQRSSSQQNLKYLLQKEKQINANLTQQINDYKIDLQELKNENVKLSNQIYENKMKKSMITQSKFLKQKQQNDLNRFQKTLNGLLELNKLKQKEISQLKQQKYNIQKNIYESQIQNKRLINELNSQIGQYKLQIFQYQNSKSNKNSSNQQLKIQIKRLKDQINFLQQANINRGTIYDSTNKIQSLTKQLNLLKKFIQQENKSKIYFLQEMESSKQKIKKVYEENEYLKSQCNVLKQKYKSDLEMQIIKKNDQIGIKNELIQNLKTCVSQLKYQINNQVNDSKNWNQSENQKKINNELRMQIKELKKSIENKSLSLQQLNQQLNLHKSKIQSLNEYINTTQVQNNSQKNSYIMQNNKLNKHIQQLESALIPIQPNNPQIFDKYKSKNIQNLQYQNSEAEYKKYEQLKMKFTKYKQTNHQNQLYNKNVKKQWDNKQAQYQTKISEYQQQMSRLESIINEKQIQFQQLISNYIKQNQSLKYQLQQKQKIIDTIQNKKNQSVGTINSYTLLFKKMNTQITALKNQLIRYKSTNIKQDQSKIGTQQLNIDINKSELWKKRQQQLIKQISSYQKNYNQLKIQMNATKSTNLNSGYQDQIKKVKQENLLQHEKQIKYTKQIQQLNVQLEQIKEEYEIHKSYSQGQQIQINKLKSLLDQKQKQYNTILSNQIQQKNRIKQLQSQLKNIITFQKQEIDNNNTLYKNQIAKLKDELQVNIKKSLIVDNQKVNFKNLQQQNYHLKQINQKLLEQRSLLEQIKNQNMQLTAINRQMGIQLKEKNNVVDHLWEVKQVQYQNIIQQISKIKQISRD